MKKILFLLVVSLCVTTSLMAQPKIRYQGDVQVGYSFGIGGYNLNRVDLHFINSARIGEYFSAGVGIGLDFYHAKQHEVLWDNFRELALPIYLNTRGYLPVSQKVSLFASLDVGASIGLTLGVKGLSGLLLSPSIGVRLHTTHRQAVTIGVGYVMQQFGAYGIKFNADAMQIKVGYSF